MNWIEENQTVDKNDRYTPTVVIIKIFLKE